MSFSESLGTCQLTTPPQTELKPKPLTELRDIFKLSKDYSSTAGADKNTSPKLSRHFKIERDGPSIRSYCNSTINTSVEELACPGNFDTEKCLDTTEHRNDMGLETTRLCKDGSERGNVKKLVKTASESVKQREMR